MCICDRCNSHHRGERDKYSLCWPEVPRREERSSHSGIHAAMSWYVMFRVVLFSNLLVSRNPACSKTYVKKQSKHATYISRQCEVWSNAKARDGIKSFCIKRRIKSYTYLQNSLLSFTFLHVLCFYHNVVCPNPPSIRIFALRSRRGSDTECIRWS